MTNQKTGERLACFELWGGNRSVNHAVELPGLAGWVYSTPIDPGAGGGDVHYFSVCSKGMVSRIAVADVAGHGRGASSMAEKLRIVLQKHTDNWDQIILMQELNEAFARESAKGQFATAEVLGFYIETGELLFCNAGHPPALWYRTGENSWEFLQASTPSSAGVTDLPLGLIAGTSYCQGGVRLSVGDMLVLYTDGITETMGISGSRLGQDGLMKLVKSLPADSPADFSRALVSGVQAFREDQSCRDDETLVVIQRRP